MTILAGIVALRGAAAPPRAVCDALARSLSRNPADTVTEFRDARLYLAKIDIGAFGAPAFIQDRAGRVSMLAGDPILGDPRLPDRQAELEQLHRAWANGEWGATAASRGNFAAVHYRPAEQRISLVTDRLGVRGLYYAQCGDLLAFATALRIIEGCAAIRLTVDLPAIAEACTFGTPLGEGTAYREVKRLLPAERVEVAIDTGAVRRSAYWRWDKLAPRSTEDLCQNLHDSFLSAVSLRARGDRTALAFLSGGLDSRCTVAALRGLGTSVHTLNFGKSRSQDRVFGALIAQGLDTHHIEVGLAAGAIRDERFFAIADAWRGSATMTARPPDRPGLIWAGDGGSVGLGHVYISRTAVALAQRRDWSGLFTEFSAHNNWSTGWQRVLRHDVRNELAAAVRDRFIAEVARIAPAHDPGRAAYLFMLFNDQRRHMDAHHEAADLTRFEFVCPFFDPAFLSIIAAAPAEPFIGHRLYIDWLRGFQPPVYNVPWQAYPGHVPCPLPIPGDLAYQWSKAAEPPLSASQRRRYLRMIARPLRPSRYPGWLLDPWVVPVAGLVTGLGIMDRSYLLDWADKFVSPYAVQQRPRGHGVTIPDRPAPARFWRTSPRSAIR